MIGSTLRPSALWQTAVLVMLALFPVFTPAQGAENGALAQLDFRRVIRYAKEKVFPAVVFIKVLRETYEGGKKTTQEITGSGVLITPGGEILTNWHVIDKAVEVRCLLHDGRGAHAEVLGSDHDMDLALIKLEKFAGKKLPHDTLGNAGKLKEGDFVMAMGAPWGLSRSVSIGIISCTRRYLPDTNAYSLWLQTDAAISPGNSGGPLVNTDGEIIGINTRGVLWGGDMGFSIPADTIRDFLPQLRAGKLAWTYTGLQLQPLRDFNRNIYFEAERGVIIAGTDPDSPAEKAGFQAHDRLLSIDGKELTARTEEDLPAIQRFLGTLAVDREVKVKVMRKHEQTGLALTPTVKGRTEGEELDCPRWDMTVKSINRFANPELFFHRKEGVFIFGVRYPGNANEAGLRPNDIILTIAGEKVTSLEEIKKIHKRLLGNVGQKHRALVVFLRNGLMRQAILDFARDYEKE